MPQTTYTNDNAIAIAGMIADTSDPHTIETFVNGEGSALPAGLLVTIKSDGTVELPKATSSTVNAVVGVTVYDASAPPGGAAIGGLVQVMRKGKIWAQYHGTVPANFAAPNVMHASDNTGSELAFRGMVTATATSTSAGVEITALGGGILARDQDTADTLVVLELNLPA